MAFLEITGLTRAFEGVIAVDSVDLSVEAGELVSIIGPNGAGKTTLFNLIAGSDRPTRGDIRIGGESVIGLRPDQFVARGIARTFQHGRIFGNLSVLDNVLIGAHSRRARSGDPVGELIGVFMAAFGGRNRREESVLRLQAETVIARFGTRLTPRLHDPASTLSYANRRRVEIARALMAQPRLLLLDEPTAGMNPTETAEMSDLIAELKAQSKTQPDGLTILLIEHKLPLVMQLSDRVVVMDDGRKIAEGSPDAVRSDPRVIEAYVGNRKNDRD